MRRWGLTATALAWATAPAGAQLTVQDVMNHSFAQGLVAAPRAEAIAWVENSRGARNVWFARGPDWAGQALTTYALDDGQEIAGLALTPDGGQVVFVRGGAPNRQGEIPDPLSTPDVEGRSVWVMPTAGGEPGKVVDAGGFALSPDGETIAYTKGREIWTVALASGSEPRRLATIRGGPGSLTWSPDGGSLAFTSGRVDHSFVGVMDASDGAVRYLDPSVAHDGEPVWSPDGRSVAFLRVPNERDVLPFATRREGLPWSIRVVDVATGRGREVWKAPPGAGSAFSGVDADRQLFWGADDLLVFPWERRGWKHLYAVSVGGGEARELTPGEFEVQYVGMTPDRRSMLYDANQGDIDRKHVWQVPLAGGAAELLTPGQGLEWGATRTPAGTLAFLASSVRRPAHAVVLAGGGRNSVGPGLPPSFPSDRLVEPQQVVFPAADGLSIHGQLFVPPNHRPGEKHPAVVFFHGGSRRQMLLGFHHRDYYSNAYGFNQVLASQGYVVLAVNYRSGIGYGMEFREAVNYGATGASEFNDVLGAGLYLQSRDDVNGDRIGLWGGSYGGYLTALGLARASDLFAAGVDLHGVHDWNVVIKNFVPDYVSEAHPDFSERAYASSPMAFLDGWRSPVLLIHGDDDRNVPFSESVDLAESLTRRGVEYEQLVFPDEVHGFLLQKNWVAAYEAALDFLNRRLEGGARPAMERPSALPTGETLQALYEGGVPFADFLENATRRKDQWDAHYGDGRVSEQQVARARAVGGPWRILAIAEDWCGDSANTIPYVARLVEQVEGLEMRVVSAMVGRSVMEAHRTPDGRAATPTLIVLDEDWHEAGCFIERPSPLMAWYLDNRSDMTSDELHEYILDWYASDAGEATVDDLLTLLESAREGHPRCGVAAR